MKKWMLIILPFLFCTCSDEPDTDEVEQEPEQEQNWDWEGEIVVDYDDNTQQPNVEDWEEVNGENYETN